LSDSDAVGHIRINQLLPNKFHGQFATPLEYVIALIRWSVGCICWLNHIYQQHCSIWKYHSY